jgi:site-specific DNA-methyltransferase (adenine-specific)
VNQRDGELLPEACICIKTFKSEAVVREPLRKKGNRETLSMVMLDYDYNGDVFDLDVLFFADAIEKADWEIRFPVESVGKQVMVVFVDIYGNEAREVIPGERLGNGMSAEQAGAKREKKLKGSEKL